MSASVTRLHAVANSLVSARLSTLRIYVSLSSQKVDVKVLRSAVNELLMSNISAKLKLCNLHVTKIVCQ